MITDGIANLIRSLRMKGKTQVQTALIAGVSERTVRKYENGLLPSATKRPRTYRTRQDPFADVWEDEIVPLLKRDKSRDLTATMILSNLRARSTENAEYFRDSLLRTLQRRISQWRALHGSVQDVVFEQEHPPGREGAFDFTVCDDLDVTIGGVPFPHLLFTFTLSCSHWMSISLAFGETFEAVLGGVQNALWTLGGVPEVLRHDNLSAATQELKKGGGRSLTKRFEDVIRHYGTRSTRIRPGHSQENGGAEKSNDIAKSILRQALVIRGSSEFKDSASYMTFVQREVVEVRNQRNAEQITEERAHLQPLPSVRLPEYTEYQPTVRSTSSIRVANRIYSVSSRLIGHKVVVRQYADHLEVYYAGELTEMMTRLRGSVSSYIDYRHVIDSLVRKPGAFARYRHQKDFFPTLRFRQSYDKLCMWRSTHANSEYLRILQLAAHTMERAVDEALMLLLAEGERFDYADVKSLVAPKPIPTPIIIIGEPNLFQYDQLIGSIHDNTEHPWPIGP